tara:strand:+ start:363 stop:587 length:225 start_codon:yes stop_codon:yes gene_type:complete
MGNESVNLIITKFSGLFIKEAIKFELLDKSIFSLLILLFVEIFNNGIFIIELLFLIIAKELNDKLKILQILNPY